MNLLDLANAATDAIARNQQALILMMPLLWDKENSYLLKNDLTSPKGIIQNQSRDGLEVHFNPYDIMTWLINEQGLMLVKRER